jgi:hypothetical protein
MTMALLHRKIISSFEQKMVNLRGLRGLKVKELRKFVRRNSMAQRNESVGSAQESQIAVFDKSLDFITVGRSLMTASGKNGLIVADDINLTSKNNFWNGYCRQVPDHGKVGEFLDENEILVLEIDSIDIWLHVNLTMQQGQNKIEAEMDLKVEKSIQLKEFNRLMQKLSLKVWNECCQVFLKKENDTESKDQRKPFAMSSNTLIKSTRDIDPMSLAKGELEMAKSLFVLTKFDVQVNDESQDESRKN